MQHSTELPPAAQSAPAPYDAAARPVTGRPAHARQALADTEPGIPAPVLAAAAGIRKAMLVPVVTALAIGTIFVAVYLAAFHAPSARHQPLGIATSDTVAARTELALNSASPNAYTFYRYKDAEAARWAITHDKVPAVLVANGHHLRLLAAGAQGPSTIAGLAAAVNEAVGHPVPVDDVRPLVAGDARGLSAFYAAFGVVLAGFLFAVSSYQIAPRLPLTARIASMAAFAVASGIVVALVAHTAMNALPASFFIVALLVGLLAWASAAATGVLLRLFGPVGMPVASVVLLILGNATSGGILPATFLPAWLSPLAQVLSPAAAIRGLRGAAYFHNAHVIGSLLTLAAWVVGSLALQYVLDRLAARRASVPAPAPVITGGR
ncbi:ABC transporter permease [Streptomyces capoamus]|uniref:ABC transporter permease n=1 Tax=Streptomyces capoamus TaxID=68183 RepID=UPI003C2CEB03